MELFRRAGKGTFDPAADFGIQRTGRCRQFCLLWVGLVPENFGGGGELQLPAVLEIGNEQAHLRVADHVAEGIRTIRCRDSREGAACFC